MEASITDVNIWKRVLDPDEIKDWSQCTNLEAGDFINWETSHVSAVGVTTQDMEKTDKKPSFQSWRGNNKKQQSRPSSKGPKEAFSPTPRVEQKDLYS